MFYKGQLVKDFEGNTQEVNYISDKMVYFKNGDKENISVLKAINAEQSSQV